MKISRIFVLQKYPQTSQENHLVYDLFERNVSFTRHPDSPLTISRKLNGTEEQFLYDLIFTKSLREEIKEGKHTNKRGRLPELGNIAIYLQTKNKTKEDILIGFYSSIENVIEPINAKMGKIFNGCTNEILSWSKFPFYPFLIDKRDLFPSSEIDDPQAMLPVFKKESETNSIFVLAYEIGFEFEENNDSKIIPLILSFPVMYTPTSYGATTHLSFEIKISNQESTSFLLTKETKEKNIPQQYAYFFSEIKNTLFVFRCRLFSNEDQERKTRIHSYLSLPFFQTASRQKIPQGELKRNSLAASGYSHIIATSKNLNLSSRVGAVEPIPGRSANYFYKFASKNKKSKGSNQVR